MQKQYYFTIKAKLKPDSPGYNTTNNLIASNVFEARNKFKYHHPEAKIISCVKGAEYKDFRKPPKKNEESSSSFGSMLLGAALTVGAGVAMSLLKKK